MKKQLLFFLPNAQTREETRMSHKSTPGSEPIYDARTLGLPKMLVLGLQHLFAMFGATVLVPILVQGYGLPLSIQTTLFFRRHRHPLLPYFAPA